MPAGIYMKLSRRSSSRGQSVVEFALIVPLLIAIMFVIVELGVIFSTYVSLTNSAREVARAGSVYQYLTPEDLEGDTPAVARAKIDAVREAYMDSYLQATLNPIVAITSLDDLNPSSGDRYRYDDVSFPNAYRYGGKLIVDLEYDHQLFFNLFGDGTITLRSRSGMKIEPGGL